MVTTTPQPSSNNKFGERYYDPNLTIWTQRDTVAGNITSPKTLNRYVYVGGDPINYVDTSGLFWKDAAAGLLGIAVGAALSPFISPVLAGAVGGCVAGAAKAGLDGKSWEEVALSCAGSAGLGALGVKLGPIIAKAARGQGGHFR